MSDIIQQDNLGFQGDDYANKAREANVPPVETLPGYGNIGFDNPAILEPPTGRLLDIESSLERSKFDDVPIINEDEAKQALLQFVTSKCCYGKSPLDSMVFTDIQSSSTFRYLLKTFYETRSTKWKHESYRGQIIINNGMPPPQPWDIPVQPKGLFQKDKVKLEIPNTAYVKSCHSCFGAGSTICSNCRASGRTNCSSCGGSGSRVGADNNRQTCSFCGGCGQRSCMMCNGTGRRTCLTCSGSGRLKWFVELKVHFDTQEDDFFKKSEAVPDKELRKCQAIPTFTEQNPRVFAINHHHEPEVNRASFDLIQNHLNKLQSTRIIIQSHVVFAIPVSLAKYKFKENDYQFHVFGTDRKVFAPDYPHKCCCCCSIL